MGLRNSHRPSSGRERAQEVGLQDYDLAPRHEMPLRHREHDRRRFALKGDALVAEMADERTIVEHLATRPGLRPHPAPNRYAKAHDGVF